MTPSTHALTTFRRASFDPRIAPPPLLPALFVLEPSMSSTAAVVSSFHPVATLQTLGVTSPSGLVAGRATIEHAVQHLGARTVVLCAEAARRPDRDGAGERLLAACSALSSDPEVGALLRGRSVTVEALWFDTAEGDVSRWQPATRRFELLADSGLERFFTEIHRRAASASATLAT